MQLEPPTPEALRGQLFALVMGAGLASIAGMLEEDRFRDCALVYQAADDDGGPCGSKLKLMALPSGLS